MPEVKHYSHLLGYLQEMGFYQSTGMGITPLSFTEIKSYLELMRLNLSVFEISTLRNMSVSYVSQSNDNYSDTTAPFNNTITVDAFDVIMNKANARKKKI